MSPSIKRWLVRFWPMLAAGFLVALVLSRAIRPGTLGTGSPAPQFEGALSNGTSLSVESFRGKVTVLNFWASWCPPCRKEAPELQAVHEELGAAGGQVIGISLDEGELWQVEGLGKRHGMTFAMGQADGATLQRYRVKRLPTTYILSPDGDVAASFVGPVTKRKIMDTLRRKALFTAGLPPVAGTGESE